MRDKFDQMLEEAEKLVTLLREHEIGIASWHEFVHTRMANLNKIYSDVPETTSTLRGDRPVGDGRRYR